MHAWIFVGEKRRAKEERRLLRLHTMATRGEIRKVNQELRKQE